MKKSFVILGIVLGTLLGGSVLAMGSNNYKIDADVIGAGGNLGTSNSYQLNDTLGEPVIGLGSSSSFQLRSGFWYMVNYSLNLSVDSNTVDLGTVTPGTPNIGQSTIAVTTDAWGGYDLFCQKNQKLTHTDATTTIDDFSATIASPASWSGTGLGFTVSSATDLETKWGNGSNFASFPLTSTVFHSKGGYTSGADETAVAYKIDVPSTQKAGSYSNVITYTAVSKL